MWHATRQMCPCAARDARGAARTRSLRSSDGPVPPGGSSPFLTTVGTPRPSQEELRNHTDGSEGAAKPHRRMLEPAADVHAEILAVVDEDALERDL